MKTYKSILLAGLMVISTVSQAQDIKIEKMTLPKAIETALVNNYDLKIANNTLEQAKNNNTLGNAGLLPSLSINGGLDYANKDTELELAGDNNRYRVDAAETMAYSANARIDYTLFDGFGSRYTYKKLNQANQMQETYFKGQMEATILQVARLYYDVCRAQKNLFLAKESMRISKDRYSRTKDKKTYGQANRLDLLNAEVDMNSDSTIILQTEQVFLMSVKNLNVALGLPVQKSYEINDVIDFRNDLTADQVLTDAMINNSSLLTQQQVQNMARSDVKITQAAKYPSIGAYGQYGYYQQDSEGSQITYNQSLGTSAGLSLKFNVFNGQQLRTREKNAKLDLLSQKER
ncbi:TolC family protein, partial [bacterium]|nr:TolC family protein [bacterium]